MPIRMPPKSIGRRLTDDDVARIRGWIERGAPYARHWAFEPPRRPKPPEVADRQAEEQRAIEAAQAEAEAAARAAAEAEEQERLAAIAKAEQELAEREARLAEQERLARERELAAERERLAAERAAAAERERQLAERERQLREEEAELARREEELAAEKSLEAEPVAPEPLPEPTATYEGNFDEAWRESQETAEVELDCDYDLRYEHVISAITAVSGFVDDGGNVVKLVEKIKFAPPRTAASGE